jgi:hypothetical protein
VKEIGEKAFCYCKSLTEITIPISVKKIKKESFAWCKKLKDVNYGGTIGEWLFVHDIFWTSYDMNPTVHCTDGDLKK